jgi:hypothetical protein
MRTAHFPQHLRRYFTPAELSGYDFLGIDVGGSLSERETRELKRAKRRSKLIRDYVPPVPVSGLYPSK